MMDSFLLGQAVQKNGPPLIRNLKEENQEFPENVIHYLSKYREKPPQLQDYELQEKVCKFISKKADFLYQTPAEREDKEKKYPDFEDTFAKMPPLETFMGIPEAECRKNFFSSVEKHDLVVGVVSSVMDSGLVITLLCMDNPKSRDIDELRISAFCPVKELPKLFPNQDAIEGFQVRDKVRAVVLNVNTETEKLIVSMLDRALPEDKAGVKLALITEDEFPVQFRRKLHIRGLTFDELLHSILGFNNSGNINCLLDLLDQEENISLMRGLNRLKVPEKDMAENLRKYQSQKMAHSSVAQGITYFKAGKQPEAVQCFNRALDIDKNNVEALVARGALYANNESFNRAIDDFEDALKTNPNHANARKYLHDTLLAFGKSNEDIEKYQEAEDLYLKAMSLNQASVEAREALRFLHYKRSQPKQDVRRLSSPKEDRTKRSPDGYEETAKTLKKLIKGDDKRHRQKRRRRSSGSSSSSSSSSGSDSSRSSNDHRRKRLSRSKDEGHRNLSPPPGVDYRMEKPQIPEEAPHKEFDVDPQSSFLSGGGASFSDLFRSSTQEVAPAAKPPPAAEGQQIQVVAAPQYPPDPWYGHPPAVDWYGLPPPDQAHMYGYYYGHPYPGMPGVPPHYYPGGPFPPDPHRKRKSRSRSFDSRESRSRSRSPSSRRKNRGRRRSRSLSSERGSPRHSRSLSYEKKKPRKRPSRSVESSRSRSPPPKRRESKESGRSRSPSYRRKSQTKKEKGNEYRSPLPDKSIKQKPDNSRRSWSSSSGESFGKPKRKQNQKQRSYSRSPVRQSGVESSSEISDSNKRHLAVEKNRNRSQEGSVRTSVERISQEVRGETSAESDKQIVTPHKVTKKEKKSEKKKKLLGEEKVKTKKKKKEGIEGKKKMKKNITENNQANVEEIRIIKTEPVKMIMKTEKDSVSNPNIDNSGALEEQGGDVRRVIPKEEFTSPVDKKGSPKMTLENKPKLLKRKKDDPLNQFMKSKWDESPSNKDSPKIREPEGGYSYKSQNLQRDRRSNSREFEGIRIHITNDQFGKQSNQTADFGVVGMFHVNENKGQVDPRSKDEVSNSSQNQQSRKPSSEKGLPDLVKSIKAKSEQQYYRKDRPDQYYQRGGKIDHYRGGYKPGNKYRGGKSGYVKHPYKKRSRSRSKSRGRSRSWSKPRGKPRSRSRSKPRDKYRSRSRSHHRSESDHGSRRRSRSRSHHRSESHHYSKYKHRSRSRSGSRPKKEYYHKPNYKSPPSTRGGGLGSKSRPIISGRNKFTGSRSPSISPGRKVEGLHSGIQKYEYKSFRGSSRGSFRGTFRGRGRGRGIVKGSFNNRKPRPGSYSRSPSPGRRNDKEYNDNRSNNAKNKPKESPEDLENFYKKLKENKKKQEEENKK